MEPVRGPPRPSGDDALHPPTAYPTKAETLTSTRRPFRPRHLLVCALTAPLLAAGLLLAPVAQAVEGPAGEGETAPLDPAGVHVPTAEELAAQQAEAQRLAAEVVNNQDALAKAKADIDLLTTQVETALAAEQTALAAQATAEAERALQEQRLAAATALVGTRKGELGRWAAQTYRHGGTTEGVMGFMTLLESESTDDLGQRVQMLDTVGGWRGSVVDTVEEAEAVQRDASQKAAAASTRAGIAAGQAVQARADADAALVAQQTKVAEFGAILAKVKTEAQAAGDKTEEMARVRAEAEQRRLALEAARYKDNRITGPVGDCLGKPTEVYGNGMIPADALCPLWAAPGHRLRADAAHAFNQLSQSYAATFGTPLCITDSYRSLEGQVAVRAAKPGLAAVPGTSNHGWGTAVDLCGGVQTFGTPQHRWMRDNAPLYGWFLPSWAQQTGSKPEPWHWEYGG